MEFNKATLYKVPFDNTYKNVVDYHKYTKTGNVLNKQTMSASDISDARIEYLDSLPKYTIYQGGYVSGRKSVKITGKYIECSIALDIDEARDYNYIMFELFERYDDRGNFLFCFINSTTSNNNSSNPSTTIYAEIDYWTQYVASISLQTPYQYEIYAHEYAALYNGKQDDRLPSDFILKNTFSFLYEDFILFIKVTIDRSFFEPQYSTTTGRFDPAGGVLDYVYVPFMAVYKQGNAYKFELITGYDYLDTNGNNASWDISQYIKKYGYFGFYDDERVHDAKLTPFTPFGIFKSTEHTQLTGGHRHFVSNVNMYWIDGGTNYVFPFTYTVSGVTYKHYIYNPGVAGKLFSMGAIFASDNSANLPIDNTELTHSFTYQRTNVKNINAYYNSASEAKFKQFPYQRTTIIFNGESYNITPEPTGTGEIPQSTIKLKLLNDIKMELHNVNNVADVYSLILVNNPSIPTSVDAYKSYALKQLDADMMKLTATQMASIASVIAGIATGNAFATIGGAVAGVNSLVNVASSVQKASQTPDVINNPSNNAFDNIYTAFPIIRESVIRDEDKENISSIWRRNGYPVKQYRVFTMKRFWFDFKQIKNASLPNITNPIARKTIEEVLNNGVTIWHANTVEDTIYIHSIGDYQINNPSNTDCEEVI